MHDGDLLGWVAEIVGHECALGLGHTEIGINDRIEAPVDQSPERAARFGITAVVNPHHDVRNPGEEGRSPSQRLGVVSPRDHDVGTEPAHLPHQIDEGTHHLSFCPAQRRCGNRRVHQVGEQRAGFSDADGARGEALGVESGEQGGDVPFGAAHTEIRHDVHQSQRTGHLPTSL